MKSYFVISPIEIIAVDRKAMGGEVVADLVGTTGEDFDSQVDTRR